MDKDLLLAIAFFLGFALILLSAWVITDCIDSSNMKACVEAGKSWVVVDGDHVCR